MIFLGDLACPHCKIEDFVNSVQKIGCFDGEIVVLNLEGVLLPDEDSKLTALHNSARFIDAFKYAKKVIVSLANNHMYDYPWQIIRTQKFLTSIGVGSFGICGQDNDVDIIPYEYVEGEKKYAFFGHCWKLYTHTNTNNANRVRVIDHSYSYFVNKVRAYKLSHHDVEVFCFMHWNYDLERLVMPMHREIARDLIDSGVSGVIGSHSHCAQGCEFYKGKPIVYGLGNFYLPSGYFFGGKLVYPDFAHKTYALKIRDHMKSIIWFDTDTEKAILIYRGEEELNGLRALEISPFVQMSDKEYLDYFMKNRTKKLFVPVFDSYKGQRFIYKELFAIARVKLIRFLSGVLNHF